MPLIQFEGDTEAPTVKDVDRAEGAHIGFVLDESGSMAVLWQDTISGFNYYIQHLREETPNAKITFVSFVGGNVKVRAKNRDIDEILSLNSKTYTPCGGTPLVDTIMSTIVLIEQQVNISPDLKPIIVVQTDGNENTSEHYNMNDLRAVVKQKRKEGWRFILITCGFNPAAIAEGMGVDAGSTIEYSRGSTKEAFKVTAKITAQAAKLPKEEVVFSLEDRRKLK